MIMSSITKIEAIIPPPHWHEYLGKVQPDHYPHRLIAHSPFLLFSFSPSLLSYYYYLSLSFPHRLHPSISPSILSYNFYISLSHFLIPTTLIPPSLLLSFPPSYLSQAPTAACPSVCRAISTPSARVCLRPLGGRDATGKRGVMSVIVRNIITRLLLWLCSWFLLWLF